MTQTLDRERRQKFDKIILAWIADSPAITDVTGDESLLSEETEKLAALLVVAARSRTEIQAEEPADESMKTLFGGDWRDYPEHLWPYAKVLRDVWKFNLPDKPQKKAKKGPYSMFIMAMEEIRQNCGEFGVKALEVTHEKWRAGFKDGIAPYTVAQPTSLINVVSATARELRESVGITQKVDDGREEGKGFYA